MALTQSERQAAFRAIHGSPGGTYNEDLIKAAQTQMGAALTVNDVNSVEAAWWAWRQGKTGPQGAVQARADYISRFRNIDRFQDLGSSFPQYDPRTLSGLLVWTEADLSPRTMNGNNVAQENDISVNDNHLVQSTESDQPALTLSAINTRPGLTLDGSSDYLNNDDIVPSTAGFTFVLALRTSADVTTAQRILSRDSDSSASPRLPTLFIAPADSEFKLLVEDDAGVFSEAQSAAAATANTNYIVTGNWTGSVAQIWVNGTAGVDGGSITLGTTTTNKFNLGAGHGGGAIGTHFNGVIGGFAFYSGALSAANRALVEQSMANRYGITLS